MKISSLCVLCVLCGELFSCSLIAIAQPRERPRDGRAIMQEVEDRHWTRYETSEVRVVLESDEGEKRERQVVFYRRSDEDLDKILVRFRSPEDLAGLGLLTYEVPAADDDQWLYVPALKRIKRIASGDKSRSFAGTDFTYADLRPEDLDAHRYGYDGREEFNGVACDVIVAEGSREEQEQSGYLYRVLYVRTDIMVVVGTDYFDLDERPIKRQECFDFSQQQGVYRPRVVLMRDLRRRRQTSLIYESRDLVTELRERMFTQRELGLGGE